MTSIRSVQALKFWESIGKPKFISAPMVDHSFLHWRILARRHGADLAYTQMFNTNVFLKKNDPSKNMIDWGIYKSSNEKAIAEAEQLDNNTIVQVAGGIPENILQTCKYLEQSKPVAIDLNLGCPQAIARKGHYGAYLLQDSQLIQKILTTMVENLSVPITAKIRVYDDLPKTLSLCKMIESCGVQALAVHGRTVKQNKLFCGEANWDIIKAIKETLSIPIIANGGLETFEDVNRCLEYTGVDAVMASEGLLENPNLFSLEGSKQHQSQYMKTQLDLAFELLDLIRTYETKVEYKNDTFRSMIFKLLYRMLQAPNNHDLREQLQRADLLTMENILKELQNRANLNNFDDSIAVQNNFLTLSSWYRRHRQVKLPKIS